MRTLKVDTSIVPLSTRIRQFIRDNVVGLVALAIALGGTAYAAAPRDSVDSRAIKNRAVKTKDLGRNAVKGSKVAAKYRHPRTGETWSGRGGVAGWLAREIKSGKKREDFLIAKPAKKKRAGKAG